MTGSPLVDSDGWHLLTGQFDFDVDGASAAGLALTDTSCTGSDVSWRGGCRDGLDSMRGDPAYAWATAGGGGLHGGFSVGSEYCSPNGAIGFSSTLNTPSHAFPGFILAHELGHNLGFNHVYNAGDQTGDVDNCLLDNPHNGSAVMGYSNGDASVTWHACSVAKFQSNLASPTDDRGVAVVRGKYSCAEPGGVALAGVFGADAEHFASGQAGFLHHLSAPPLSAPEGGEPSDESPPPLPPPTPGATPAPSPSGGPSVASVQFTLKVGGISEAARSALAARLVATGKSAS